MSKTLHRNLQAKMVKLQGTEWDSSDEETEETKPKILPKTSTKKDKVVTTGKKGNTTTTKQSKGKQSMKEKIADEESEQDATVLYIGHLPDEFEERDLRNFLQQFGKLINLRISRSVTSGNSRGYAFVRWDDAETASIVAETLQGYLIGGRRLVCHTVPNPNKHMFFNTDSVIEKRKLKRQIEEKKRIESLQDAGKMKEITARLVKRERQKRAKLEELGIEYDFPGYEANQMSSTPPEETKDIEEQPKEVKPEGEKKKKRKESMDDAEKTQPSTSPSKKRKESIDSQGSATKHPKSAEKTSQKISNKNDDKKKKKRRESAP